MLPTILLRLEKVGSPLETVDVDPEMVTATLDGVPLVRGVDFEVNATFAGGAYVFLGRQLTDGYAFEIAY